MQKEKVYVIERNGLLLDQLFCDDVNEMFNAKGAGKYENIYDVGNIYFYHNHRIAADVADQLGASWLKAIRNGLKVELI